MSKKIQSMMEFKNPIAATYMRLTQPFFPPPYLGYTEGARSRALNKRALILYLSRPFYTRKKALTRVHHSNLQQVIEIGNAFNRLGYVADVVDWLDTTFCPSKHYDVFFGMHHSYERISKQLPDSCKKIYYATGTYWQFENSAEQQRVQDLKQRRGISLKLPARLSQNKWVEDADAVIVMGNKFTEGTYKGKNPNIYQIDNSALTPFEPIIEKKNYALCRNNFLAFPSTGLLHKGLDLVLEAFADLKDHTLWVCGPLQSPSEKEFVRLFSKELFETPNIQAVGWTDLYSSNFRKVVAACGSIIFPSCAEGSATGVLTCMRCGLIPIVSLETGIDTDEFGVTLKNCSVDEIRNAVENLSRLPPTELKQRALTGISVAKTRYSLQVFGKRMEDILSQILRSE
jgi:glycosyltransferase involved in cell wall biosynthesis